MDLEISGAQQLSTDTTVNSREKSGDTTQANASPKFLLQAGLLLLLVAATFLAYSPVLFNFFNGDDFVHLTWLSKAIHEPELVWRNFHTSWLDGTTTKFYRPLISVFMVSDYAMYGLNGLGFRITNIIFHLSSTLFIFLIAKQLQVKSESANRLTWPFFAAALFALYPLHPEAVSWITGRVDSVVTPFCLGSVYFYMRYSQSRGMLDLILSLVAATLGLLSKEMAITLPAVFVLYELIFNVLWQPKNRVMQPPESATAGSSSPSSAAVAQAGSTDSAAINSTSAAINSNSTAMNSNSVTTNSDSVAKDLVAKDLAAKNSTATNRSYTLVSSLAPLLCTAPFWILLAVYFYIRYLALGTLVGGYDNSLLFISNPKEFLRGWLHAIAMFLVPINKSLIGSHHIISKLYPALTIYALVATVLNTVLETRSRRNFIFLSGWLVLCLVPVYKLFNIADDLQGSRLAYLATVPLCMLLTCGLLECKKLDSNRLWSLGNKIIMIAFLFLSAFVLWTNNLPWKSAGEENNAIRASLQALYGKLEGDPEVLILGLPDQINGAYTCRNSLDGMTKKPQMDRDVYKCLMVNAFDPIFPFGFLKDSISTASDKIHVFRWDTKNKNFVKVDMSAAYAKQGPLLWTKDKLKQCASVPEQKMKPDLSFDIDGNMLVKAHGKQPEFVQLDLGKNPCFTCDFIEVKLELEHPAAAEAGADILYTNDMFPDFELRRRTRAHFVPGQKQQRLLFALRGLPEWSLGGDTHPFRLLFPQESNAKVSSVAILPRQDVMPSISFNDSGYFGSKGFIHLSAKEKNAKIDIDVSKIKGASKFATEITRTNLLFEEQNPQARSKVADGWHITDKTAGQIVLNQTDFSELKSAGLYEIRFFPLSSNDTICGAASDHLVISVDP